MMDIVTDPYATGVLQKEHHARLVADLDNFARDAGIQKRWISEPLPSYPVDVKQYLKGMRRHLAGSGVGGLCITGPVKGMPLESHLSAMTGYLVRNFLRARVITLSSLVDLYNTDALPDLPVILCPNFYVQQPKGMGMPSWQLTVLFDLLTDRLTTGRQTILYVHDRKHMASEYGSAISGLIENHYETVSI